MEIIKCPSCGSGDVNASASGTFKCNTCGTLFTGKPESSDKNRLAAGILAILLGGFGVHKFYMGKIGQGFLYLLFCWTSIPAFIGLVEGIIYLLESDEEFYTKHIQ